MIGKLIRCTECNAIINMTEGDFYPSYAWNNDGELKEIAMDDRKAFRQKHKGHKTEKLTPLTPPISDKPYIEPLKTCYFEATNGTERFLIKRWRSKIDEPLAYEIIEGSIAIKNGRVRAQTTAIKKQLQAENNLSISERKVNYFIQAVRTEVEQLDPDTLTISAEGETPLASYYQLGSTCVERILARCRDTFTQRELNKLRDFINQHNEYDDVMTVISKKEFAIKPSVQKEDSREAVRPDRRVATSR
jgi:hypothetical protein